MPSQTMALHGIPLTGSVSLLVPRPTRGAGGGGGAEGGRRALSPRDRDECSDRHAAGFLGRRGAPIGVRDRRRRRPRGGRREGSKGEGRNARAIYSKRTGRISAIFCGIFRGFSPRIRIGGGAGGGMDGGDRRRRAPGGAGQGGGGARKREGGGYLSQRGVRAIRKGR